MRIAKNRPFPAIHPTSLSGSNANETIRLFNVKNLALLFIENKEFPYMYTGCHLLFSNHRG